MVTSAENKDFERITYGLFWCVLFIFMLMMTGFLIWPIYRLFLPLPIFGNEAWNAYHADVIISGHPLYSFDDFTLNNYPPLSFYLVSAISEATKVDPLYVGRMLSLLAAFATAGAVWACIRILGGSHLAASLGAAWWLATMARWFNEYVGTNDPQLVALALMTWALVYVLRYPNSWRGYAALIFMAVAGFYKHNLFSIPIAAVFFISLHSWNRGLIASILGLITVSVGFFICTVIFGKSFFYSIMLPRTYNFRSLLDIRLAHFLAFALIFSLTWWCWYRRKILIGRFILFFIIFAFLSFEIQKTAAGVSDNSVFELILSTAIGLGLAFSEISKIPEKLTAQSAHVLIVILLIVNLIFTYKLSDNRLEAGSASYSIITSSNFRRTLEDRVSIMRAETNRIAGITGPVVCKEATLVCRFAGKPFLYESFVVEQAVQSGRLSEVNLVKRIHELDLKFEAVDARVNINELILLGISSDSPMPLDAKCMSRSPRTCGR